jgi:hypothetical protein
MNDEPQQPTQADLSLLKQLRKVKEIKELRRMKHEKDVVFRLWLRLQEDIKKREQRKPRGKLNE